jgi:hypothetical protein
MAVSKDEVPPLVCELFGALNAKPPTIPTSNKTADEATNVRSNP